MFRFFVKGSGLSARANERRRTYDRSIIARHDSSPRMRSTTSATSTSSGSPTKTDFALQPKLGGLLALSKLSSRALKRPRQWIEQVTHPSIVSLTKTRHLQQHSPSGRTQTRTKNALQATLYRSTRPCHTHRGCLPHRADITGVRFVKPKSPGWLPLARIARGDPNPSKTTPCSSSSPCHPVSFGFLSPSSDAIFPTRATKNMLARPTNSMIAEAE